MLWGTTPIALACVLEGRSVSVSDAGVVLRGALARSTPGPIRIGVEARGATIEGASGTRVVTPGDEARFELTRRPSSVYRTGEAAQPEALGLVVAVTSRARARPPRRPPAWKAWLASGCSAAAHALLLTIGAAHAPSHASAQPSVESAGGALVRSDAYLVLPEAVDEPEEKEDEGWVGPKPQICGPQPGPIVGRSVWIRGPEDNPDPHLARRHPPPSHDVGGNSAIGSLIEGDPIAAIAPWGYDDSLGRDPRSTMGVLPDEFDGEHLFNQFASCFGDPQGRWSCSEDLPEPPNAGRLGLSGIGDDLSISPDRAKKRRHAHVALGPVGIWANVPRWAVMDALRATVEEVRACYERALLDAPAVTGRTEIVLRVRGYDVTTEVASKGDINAVPALACCVEQTQYRGWYDLPTGAVVNARYSFAFGSPRR